MGYIIIQLIIFILQGLKYIGDGTIWVFNKLFLLIVFSIRYIVKIISSSFHIRISLQTTLLSTLHFLKDKIRQLSFPKLSFHPFTFFKKRKKKYVQTHAIGSYTKLSSFSSFQYAVKFFLLGFFIASVLIGSYATYYILSKDLPHPQLLTKRDIPLTTKIYDRNGKLLYEIYADQNRTPITLDELPDYFINATIAIEDQGFYHHWGFSPKGIVRAAYNIVVRDDLQGGSTITQQLVRSAFLTREISISRKIKEIILSIWTERIYSKKEILTMYFNQVPYGGTAWGAQAAARTYFGKDIKDVTLAEAAFLAGLPAAPTTFSPFGLHPELAKIRQKEVLRRMEEEGFITKKEREQAENEPLLFSNIHAGIRAPHFVMFVRNMLNQRYGPRMVEQGGLIVQTTLDLSLQEKVQKIVKEEVEKLRNLNVGNGAALVTDPKTGEILAMVGSTDYFDTEHDGNVNIAVTPQQPGSTIKVVTYAAALQNGFTAATLLNDAPITFTVSGSKPYSPVNYDNTYHGLVPLRYALASSLNIPAVKTLAKIGIPTLIEQGRKMGIDSWKDTNTYGLSLTLGGGEVTMLDMAETYGTLAAKGYHHELTPFIKITDHLGNVLENSSERKGNQAVPEEIAFIISDILSDNQARSMAFGPSSQLYIPNARVAVKTGTSNDKRDNWAIGYTSDFVVTVWVGNNDNSPMSNIASGVTGATPIWRKITDEMLKQYPFQSFSPPQNIRALPCRGRIEYFIIGTEPKGGCRPIPTPTPTPDKDNQNLSEENQAV